MGTDGMPTNPYKVNVASKAVKKSARLIWVPVGSNAPLEMIEKKKWASMPVEQNIVPVKDFKELEKPGIVSKIVPRSVTKRNEPGRIAIAMCAPDAGHA